MDAVDGFNSKINAVAIQSLDDVQLPAVIGSVPADGATNVSLSSSISANFLHFPNLDNTGATGINNNTITTANVKLYKVVGNTVTQVTISVNGTGGGDAINISLPSSTLDANTRYRYTIEGVEDITGAELFPFSAEFVTGSSIGGTGGGNLDNVSFTNSGTVANGNYHTLTIGPDGKLYGLTSLGEIHRWIMNVDGSLSNKEILTGFNDSQGLQICIGLEFALNATANNLVAYVTHSSLPDGEGEAFGGGLTRLSGSNLQNGQQILTNLPRSIKDHFPLSITTDPVDPNILYFNQGSNSAAGEPDGGWGFRPERLLTAATLKLDLSKLPNNLPLDVKTSVNQSVINSATTNSATMSDGSYNPYFVNAPLTLFATGLRNAYDLVWHSNGQLYVPTNGTAGNSNAPASVNGTRRPDGSFYNGPTIPALFGNQVQRDFLYRIDPDLPTGYYGHPNPTRGEFVLNRGPVDESDYPSSVQVDANYRGIAFDFEFNKSPNGVIEYKTAGDLQGAMIVCRYSGGSDLIALLPDGPNGDVSTSKIGIPGFAGLNNPLDIIEDTNTGNLYVTDLGESAILLLKPSNGVAPSAFNVSFITPFNNSSIAVGGSLDVEVLASSNTGSISNVQLFLNNELVRQENGAPYEWGLASQRDDILENLAEGTYTLKAVATDSGGNKAESSITVNVGQSTSGLNISFSSPEDGDVYAIGQDLNIEIFTSNNALVSNIDLFLNNQLVRRERGAPYEWGLDSQPDDILENLAVGTYVLKAVATDTGGNIVETSITITVGQGNSGLNLSFAAPLNGADLAVGTDLDVEILTNDNSLVSSIDLFLNNQLVRRERGAPYEWGLDSQPDAILENLSAGTYELRAVATQTGGNIVEESITVTVGQGTSGLNLTFAAPLNGTDLAVGTDLDVEILTNDNSLVSSIDLFLNNQLVRRERGAPYEWGLDSQPDAILENLSAGTYELRAVATTTGGNTVEESITITVGQSASALSIWFAAPINGANLPVGTDLDIAILTTDDNLVSKIELYLNDEFVRQELHVLYGWGGPTQGDAILENLSAGTYVLKAIATDTGGKTIETSITITVGQSTSALNLSFAAPLNGADLAVGTDLDVEVLTNNNSLVATIDLFLNNQLVRREGGAPYEWGLASQTDAILENLSAGTYVLKAIATDTGGNTVETSITITVGQSTSDLNISFAAPLNRADLAVGTDLEVEILTNDNSLVATIDLFLNNQLVRRERGAPYEWGLTSQTDAILENLSAGTYVLKAIATDTGGNTRESTITITVGQSTSALNLSFATPLNGADLAAGTDLDVEVLTNDNSLVSNIDLFLNNQLVRRERGAPYEWGLASQNDDILENLSAGTYTLKAVATDKVGNTVEESITITIGQSTSALNLSFATPLNGADLAVGTDLEVVILTNDNSLVSNIDLFLNNQLVRRERGAPYEWGLASQSDAILENLAAGTYVLKAVATDKVGNTVEESITITVGQIPSGLNISFAEPLNSAQLVEGTDLYVEILTNDNSLVSNIRLFLNNEFVRQEGGAPYEWGLDSQPDDILENLGAGVYVLKAVATDTDGNTVETSITVTVQGEAVVLTEFPEDLQFYARDVQTNKSTIAIEGQLNTAGSSIRVVVLRNGQFYNQEEVTPSGLGFSLTTQIDAELAKYTVQLYVVSASGQAVLHQKAENVVAGDVYIITGQSNAEARNFLGSAAENNSDYIRVFGYGGDDVNTLNNNLKWFIGQGDGDSYSLGNTGQWGLHLAKQIIDSQNVPVCIFNGAKGGRSISHFAKDDATPENIETNYGRLLYRLRQTKLADKVRAIFWYQGASDASNGTALSTYKQAFTTLQNNWLVDYPTIEHTYITQIKDGCGQTQLRNVIIQEAHRQLGQERPATTTMSTKGMLHEDGCHFAYEDGYKELGRRYFRLVSRDLYGESVVAAASPDVEAIYFTTNDEIIIQSKDGGNLTWENGAEIYFQLEGSNATIVSGSTDGDKVILQLSGDGSDATGLTYLDENDVISPYVISQDGHGLLSFYNFPIIKSGNISVRNLRLIPGTERGFPYDDRVIFHRFLGRDENSFNLTSMFGSIEIANNGSGVLTVNDVTINSADFEIVSGGGSFQLAANETREVLIEFVKNSGVLNELYEAQLRVNSNDSSNPVTSITLAGHYSGSTAVPNVHEISAVNMMDLFGFDTKVVADGELLVSDYPTAEEVASGSYGDIVVSKLWEQADPSQPISVLFTNVLQGPGTSRITLTNEQGGVVDDFSIRSSAQWVQGLFPSTASSPLELATAGKSGYATAPFYLNINGSTTLGSQGTQANGDPVTLPLRLFKIFEADGTLRPNEYYAMMDYIPSGGCVQNAGSCDFNDNGFYITNIKPIDESRIASIVANVGDGEQVSQDINTSSTATNTTCGEVAITYGVGTITFEGIANKDYFFKINDLNDNWATVGGCSWNCGNQLTVNDLANSNYLLTVYNADWSIHCDTEIQMTGSNIIAPSASDRTTSQLTFAAYQAHRAVDLQWLSNSGYKVNTFEVEHSLDGENFSQIGQLTNKKWSNELEYHQTIDEQPKKGVNYYRVKENYLNGSFAYTPVQSVVFGIDLAGISIFPNPAREALFINLGLQDGLQADLTMTNHLGQEVKALKVESMDNQLIQLNTADLLNGLYYLNISVEGQKSFTKKVLINHLY